MIKSKGWSVENGVATLNSGTLADITVHGKVVDQVWTYRAVVTINNKGLSVVVEDDEDESGMAHGGSYTDLCVPPDVLLALITGKSL